MKWCFGQIPRRQFGFSLMKMIVDACYSASVDAPNLHSLNFEFCHSMSFSYTTIQNLKHLKMVPLSQTSKYNKLIYHWSLWAKPSSLFQPVFFACSALFIHIALRIFPHLREICYEMLGLGKADIQRELVELNLLNETCCVQVCICLNTLNKPTYHNKKAIYQSNQT